MLLPSPSPVSRVCLILREDEWSTYGLSGRGTEEVVIINLDPCVHQHASGRRIDPPSAATLALLAERPRCPGAVLPALHPVRGRSGAGAEEAAAVIAYPHEGAQWVGRGGECDCGRQLLETDEAVGADEERVFWVRLGQVRDAGGNKREERAAFVRGQGAEEDIGERHRGWREGFRWRWRGGRGRILVRCGAMGGVRVAACACSRACAGFVVCVVLSRCSYHRQRPSICARRVDPDCSRECNLAVRYN